MQRHLHVQLGLFCPRAGSRCAAPVAWKGWYCTSRSSTLLVLPFSSMSSTEWEGFFLQGVPQALWSSFDQPRAGRHHRRRYRACGPNCAGGGSHPCLALARSKATNFMRILRSRSTATSATRLTKSARGTRRLSPVRTGCPGRQTNSSPSRPWQCAGSSRRSAGPRRAGGSWHCRVQLRSAEWCW